MSPVSIRRVLWPIAGLAGLVLGWLTYSSYKRDITAARARVATGSLVAQTRCGPIEYAVAGEGSPVLVVHGAGGGYDQGLDIGGSLVGKGFRIVAMSRFGYLRTPLPQDASPAAQADAHACLLDSLGIPRVAVLGVSAGAPSAMQFAIRHAGRCRALVLLSPAAYAPPTGSGSPAGESRSTGFLLDTTLRFDFLFWLATRTCRTTMIRSLAGTPPEVVESASAAEREKVTTVIEHLLPVVPRRLGLLNDATVVSSLVRYELEQIKAPTLAISMVDDLYRTFDGARYTAEQVPGGRFIGFPSGGHLWVEHTEEILAATAEFLKSGH